MTTRAERCCWLASLALLVGAAVSLADDQADFEKLKELHKQAIDAMEANRPAEAEKAAREMLRLAERTKIVGPDAIAVFRGTLADCCRALKRHAEAVELYEPVLAHWDKKFRANPTAENAVSASYAANAAAGLGCVYMDQGRYDVAEPRHQYARDMRTWLPADFPDKNKIVAASWQDLGELYRRMGRFAEAERFVKDALDVWRKELPNHRRTALSMQLLAELCRNQGRLDEAQPLLVEAKTIWEGLGPEAAPEQAKCLSSLALLHYNRWQESQAAKDATTAEGCYAQACDLFRQLKRFNDPDFADSLNNQGRFYHEMGYGGDNRETRYLRAKDCYSEALGVLRQAVTRHRFQIADTLNNLALLYYDQRDYPKAEEEVAAALDILSEDRFAPLEYLFNSHCVRAKILWETNRQKEALQELRRAMDLADRQRAQGAGSAYDVAAYFSQLDGAFERMVLWQAELQQKDGPAQGQPHASEAYLAMERARARSLLNQMALQGVDPLAGLPDAEAKGLREGQKTRLDEIARLELSLRLLNDQPGRAGEEWKIQYKALREQLGQAREKYRDAQRDIWGRSPTCRKVLGESHEPVPFEQLRTWAKEEKAIVLEYLLGVDGAYVVVIPGGGEPRVERLVVSQQQARTLGIEAGRLTARQFDRVMRNKDKLGVYECLRRGSANDVGIAVKNTRLVVPKLAVLWEVLVPSQERENLEAKKYSRLLVIPDGVMAQFPFETLVLRGGDAPQYLLDLEMPVLYAPSVKTVWRLKEDESKPIEGNVLTVGDCRFGVLPGQTEPLGPLEASLTEVEGVTTAFGPDRVKALTGEAATEAAVRENVLQKRLLHFACHGLADETGESLFASLAFTPGKTAGNPADDGFLTLAEIYQFNLRGCELVILSACSTNEGRKQRGEGVWALARGFLVAGSRRVVATDWRVDDRAGASVAGVFCAELAKADKAGKRPDYAQALCNAKRTVRKEQNWESPYYWGTFVLVGPH